MIYKSVSIKEVIGRVIRNTRLTDTGFIQDMNEWIPEAMGYMKTNMSLSPRWEDINIDYYKAKMPCGLDTLIAVTYNGYRLKANSDVRNYDSRKLPITDDTVFISDKSLSVVTDNPVNPTNITYSQLKIDIRTVKGMPESGGTYYTEMDFINTSICTGTVRIYFLGIPTDEEGYPLIPDNENYKQAIYWYVRGQMIGCGYADPVFKYADCVSQFELYAARAIGEIIHKTPDEAETIYRANTRLILPDNSFDSFFGNRPTEQKYFS